MSGTLAITVPVEAGFWTALIERDYETAEALLTSAIVGTECCRCDGDNVREGDILSQYLSNYIVTVRGTLVEESLSLVDVTFNDTDTGGTFSARFEVSVHLGCKDINGQDAQYEEISFSIDKARRIVRMNVLEFPVMFSEE